MQPDELVLSDFHIGCVQGTDQHEDFYKTRILYSSTGLRRLSRQSSQVSVSAHSVEDEDSDPDLDREVTESAESTSWDHYLVVEHAMATNLEKVGLQVWQGALGLCDWILHSANQLKSSQPVDGCWNADVLLPPEKVIVELGAGTGLPSILVSQWLRPRQVFCTDADELVLNLCVRNVERNITDEQMLQRFHVRHLNWSAFAGLHRPEYGVNVADRLVHAKFLNNTQHKFSFEEAQILAKEVDWIIAADVVYQMEMTRALLCLVHSLLCTSPTAKFLCFIERRCNFVVTGEDDDDEEVGRLSSGEFDYFVESLAELDGYEVTHCISGANGDETGIKEVATMPRRVFRAREMPLSSLPKYCIYQRSEQLRCWVVDTVESTDNKSDHD